MSDGLEASVTRLDGLTLGAALRHTAQLHGEHEAIKSGERVLTFAQFDTAADRLAEGLLALGVCRGDHVAVWLNNSIEWALTLCACAKIGAVLIPINTRYTPSEAGYILAQSDAKALVMTRHLWKRDYLESLGEIAPGVAIANGKTLDLPQLPALRHLVFVGDGGPPASHRFEALLQRPPSGALAAAEAQVQPDDPLLICYTSGTTGKPKGAMHNHRVIKQATRVGLACGLQPGGRVLGHMPVYHVAGLYMGLVPALTLGACFIVMPQWDANEALALIERERITMFGGIPTHFVDLVASSSVHQRDLSSLEIAWIGGSPVMQATFEGFMKTLGLKHLLSTYGMTENTISTTFNRLDDPVSICCQNKARILGQCEVRIVDTATCEPLPVGEIGEVWCRGETVMMGYYRNTQATAETITPEGWLRTGDLGRFDEAGYLSITGRAKEMYKSGGTNVYPAEIEQHLARHPAIKIAAVVGVPDERLGEVGYAFVELHPAAELSAAQVVQHCRGVLADYKIPRHISFVAEMPRTVTGKIPKGELYQRALLLIAPARGAA
ncbi:MAG: AMP-binding protein [Burkholderiales bacterium]|nr:AMP-binding protein [Burkholderiales bacterium]